MGDGFAAQGQWSELTEPDPYEDPMEWHRSRFEIGTEPLEPRVNWSKYRPGRTIEKFAPVDSPRMVEWYNPRNWNGVTLDLPTNHHRRPGPARILGLPSVPPWWVAALSAMLVFIVAVLARG